MKRPSDPIMPPLLTKVDPGQIPLSPHLIMIEGQALEAPLHQNKIPLLRDLIPLARGQIPPDQDPILDPQEVDHQLPKEINIGINILIVIQRNGGENFTNCNFHPTRQMKQKLAIGNSC